MIFKNSISLCIQYIKSILLKINLRIDKYRVRNKTKYFCIGRNKTGTTSLAKEFKELGFVVGNQRSAEYLLDDYFENDFLKVIDYCKTAEVFQDVPFSLPKAYEILDRNFPGSKYILTIRDNSEQWYNSVVKFQTKIFGKGNLPTWEMLKEVKYVYKGWYFKNRKKIYNLTEIDDPYDKEKLISHYEKYNIEVLEYFRNRPNDLLVINLSAKNSYAEFCNFIGVEKKKDSFPWENKTEKIKI